MSIQQAEDDHYWLVASRILASRVVPLLGAGANLCGRPDGVPWALGQFLPSGRELAESLAGHSRYPVGDDLDLLRVSQYVDAVLGEHALYEYLRIRIFDAARRTETSALAPRPGSTYSVAFSSTTKTVAVYGAQGLDVSVCEACQGPDWLEAHAGDRLTHAPAEVEAFIRNQTG
jgi:hypothetical protein